VKRILVNLINGLIEVKNIPSGVEVVVRDYDIEGCGNDEKLVKDEDVIPCFESVWSFKEI